jgi:hypothetical protein
MPGFHSEEAEEYENTYTIRCGLALEDYDKILEIDPDYPEDKLTYFRESLIETNKNKVKEYLETGMDAISICFIQANDKYGGKVYLQVSGYNSPDYRWDMDTGMFFLGYRDVNVFRNKLKLSDTYHKKCEIKSINKKDYGKADIRDYTPNIWMILNGKTGEVAYVEGFDEDENVDFRSLISWRPFHDDRKSLSSCASKSIDDILTIYTNIMNIFMDINANDLFIIGKRQYGI